MTPSARLAAAIGLLDSIVAGDPAERALTRWARGARYAGSKDRAAVRDIVFDVLRRRRSYLWLSGQTDESGRALVIGHCLATGHDLAEAFDGSGHGPAVLSSAEQTTLRPELSQASRAVALDYPDFLDVELHRSLGDNLQSSMAALRNRATVDLRANLLKSDPQAAQAALAREDILTECVAPLQTALRVTTNERRVAGSSAYRDGLVDLQDAASQDVALLAGAAPDMTVLDYCAGGGGKTLAMAATMQGRGRLVAHDVRPQRMKDIPSRTKRASARIELMQTDALAALKQSCDLVLVDAPCSGTGAWRRNPDAKWRLTEARLRTLCQLQGEILDQARQYVRPGGRLVYATCSILRCENADVAEAFAHRHPTLTMRRQKELQIADAGDGFYFVEFSV
ncbi:RsmB/NOP family class I SAM-dependent RNA methyltransferase [Halovulum sp. GXIMD14793]